MLEIEFIDVEPSGKNAIYPMPAIKKIPSWYKKMPALRKLYKNMEKEDFTIKKCIPVLDAFSTGYYLVTKYNQVWSINENGEHVVSCPQELVVGSNKPITMHPFEQIRDIELAGMYNEYAYKFGNPFVIKTPPGYSCIFTHPFNQLSPFYTLTGVVDTDSHPLAVQFPFLMLKNFQGTIPSGTPIVQIIPFKRDDWQMYNIDPGKKDMQDNAQGHDEFLMTRHDEKGNNLGGEYKKKHRVKKKYF